MASAACVFVMRLASKTLHNVRIRGGDAHADAPWHIERPFDSLSVLLFFRNVLGQPVCSSCIHIRYYITLSLAICCLRSWKAYQNGCENPFGSDPNRTLSSYRGGTSLDCSCQNQNNPAVGAAGGAALIFLALAIFLYFPLVASLL